jgi:putative FmdB family regulatory protein
MPIYEYRCKKGHTFDVMQRFSDDPLTECEICGAPAQRVLHAPAVHFKGSGFYNTDYGTRKRSREMKEQKDGAKSESSGGSSEGKSAGSESGGSGSSSNGSSTSKDSKSGSGSGSSASSSTAKSAD